MRPLFGNAKELKSVVVSLKAPPFSTGLALGHNFQKCLLIIEKD
jgi:hypothetical protein